jgi:DNA-binding transcriptional LysR family regulator
MVDVREARYFIAVAEELHFGRAAGRLHMSQPPLSQAIKAIEGRLGVTLLHRTTREVALTPAGTVFLDRCRVLLGAAESADAAAQAVAEGAAGQLRIGAVTSAFLDPLPAALQHFRRHRPAVDVRVEEIDSHVAVQAVRRRELDVVFVRQLATPSDCVQARLRTERFVLAIPAAWAPPPSAEGLTLAADLPWVWIPRTISPDYHDQIVACCRAAGFAPDARHTAQSIVSQLAMVACGLGVALVPESATQQLRVPVEQSIHLVPLENSPTIELAAVWHRGPNRLVEGLLDSARTILEERHSATFRECST